MSTMNKMDMAEVHGAVTDLNKEKLIELLHGDSEPVDLSKVKQINIVLCFLFKHLSSITQRHSDNSFTI